MRTGCGLGTGFVLEAAGVEASGVVTGDVTAGVLVLLTVLDTDGVMLAEDVELETVV